MIAKVVQYKANIKRQIISFGDKNLKNTTVLFTLHLPELTIKRNKFFITNIIHHGE